VGLVTVNVGLLPPRGPVVKIDDGEALTFTTLVLEGDNLNICHRTGTEPRVDLRLSHAGLRAALSLLQVADA
jgi:hypothetical protein